MATKGAWEELFGGGRKWRVAEELTGELVERGFTVKFSRGWFELPPGAAYRSPLSTNLGRRGLVLQETDDPGVSDISGSCIAVGEAAVSRARTQFGAVW